MGLDNYPAKLYPNGEYHRLDPWDQDDGYAITAMNGTGLRLGSSHVPKYASFRGEDYREGLLRITGTDLRQGLILPEQVASMYQAMNGEGAARLSSRWDGVDEAEYIRLMAWFYICVQYGYAIKAWK